ncbi:MAG: hypothetical protein Q8939_13615 [Bacteroidota bacterium]|nr:hypothetical protein [Bacteroidota bacterium]
MRYDYVVTLKRENARRTDLASFLLMLFSILAFIFVQVRSLQFSYFLSLAALLLLAGILINISASRKGKEMRFRNWLLAAGVFWIGMPFLQWMILVFIFFSVLEGQTKYPLEIGFNADQIVLNTFFKKKIFWNTLNGVILKDGMLTLDFRNNKLLQKEVLDDDGPEADENEFNEYCREQLERMTVDG